MNVDNLAEFLALCRTCLQKANNPIFANETDAASYSEMFFIVTGIKVEIDDRLPQNICQNCLNNINNSLKFRKQCKEAETQLLILKSKVDNREIKLEIGSEFKHSNKSQHNSIVSIALNTKIEDEKFQMKNYINDKQENFRNDKNSHTKTDLTKLNLNGKGKQKDNCEIKTVVCKLCKKSIATRKYHAHVARKHNPTMERNVMCNICSTYFNRKQLIKHIHSTHTKKNHEEIIDDNMALSKSTNNNTLINKSYNSEIDYYRGKRQIRKLNEFPKNILNKSLNLDNENICCDIKNNDTLINELTTEVVSYCNDKQIKTEPNEAVSSENILYNCNNTVSKRVTCKLCQKDLSIRSVDSHMTRHHPGADKRRVKCDLCDNYVLKSKLNRHTALMHDSGFLCRYCKYKFGNKEELVEHISNCIKKKKWRICDSSRELRQCDECHKTMQKGSLRVHKATKHAGLRPACEHCGKSFGNKVRLHDHYRAKHGYEKFKCSCCDFQSACALSMANHERRHRGEKPFLCETCGADFHAAYLLAQHRQSHAADKAFQCDICPASFKVNNTLHMHKRSCHGTSKYACTMCARTYRTRNYVVKHMRAVHRFTGPVPPMQPVEC